MPFMWPWTPEHTADISNFQWYVIRTAGFAIIAWLVWKFIVPVVAGMLADRRASIAEAAEQVETTLEQTRQMRNDYRERLERIEIESQVRMDDAVREAGEIRDQILAEAVVSAQALVRRAEQDLVQEHEKALVHLRAEFVDDVIEAARHAASSGLTRDRQRALVGDFVRELGAVQ